MNRLIKRVNICLYGLGRFFFRTCGSIRPKKLEELRKKYFDRIKSDFVIIDGQKMFLDSGDSLGLSVNGVYEEFEREFFKKNIKKGDRVLDLGANIGYFTLLFAKLVGEGGKVFAFEPDKTNFSILKKNVLINNHKNVVLINSAVSDVTGSAKLFLCDENKGDHRIYDSKDGRKFIKISSIRIDDYFKDKDKRLDIIKMDIQGAEYRALRGMDKLLIQNPHVKVYSEFWPIGLKRSGVKPLDYLRNIRKRGFKILEMDDSIKKTIEIKNLKDLLRRYSVKNGEYTNLLFIK